MYFDPGFGGMLLQVFVAIAAVGGALLYSLRKKIKGLFTKKKDDEKLDAVITPIHSDDDDAVDMLDGSE